MSKSGINIGIIASWLYESRISSVRVASMDVLKGPKTLFLKMIMDFDHIISALIDFSSSEAVYCITNTAQFGPGPNPIINFNRHGELIWDPTDKL
ncbi:hypothetical protein Tco_0128086 [Tanacetum coccineum]